VHEWKREILETLFGGTLAGRADLQKNAGRKKQTERYMPRRQKTAAGIRTA